MQTAKLARKRVRRPANDLVESIGALRERKEFELPEGGVGAMSGPDEAGVEMGKGGTVTTRTVKVIALQARQKSSRLAWSLSKVGWIGLYHLAEWRSLHRFAGAND